MAKLIVKIATAPLMLLATITMESDTFMSYCLGLVDLENKVVCVKSNDADVFTIMLGNYEKLNDLTLLIARSNEMFMNLTKIYE